MTNVFEVEPTVNRLCHNYAFSHLLVFSQNILNHFTSLGSKSSDLKKYFLAFYPNFHNYFDLLYLLIKLGELHAALTIL